MACVATLLPRQALFLREGDGFWVGVEMGVGVDESDFLGWNGGGEKMLFLRAAVPESGSEDLDGVAVEGPPVLVAALELEGAGGNADDIAAQVDHGAVGKGVNFDGAVAELGFVFAFAGLEVDGAFGRGAAGEK